MYRLQIKKIKNTDKFRPAAVNFELYGNYTTAPKGTTAFYDYWDEETKRCLNGFTAPDGDHITGYYYFYLNYCQILEVVINPITNKAEKKKWFPKFWDYDKAFFDTVEECENQGKHLAVLKARRKGYSYKVASMLCRNFYFIPGSNSYVYAAENEFLTKDGTLTKAWEYMDFVDEYTAWYKKRQKIDRGNHKRASAIVDKEGVKVEIGYKSDIIGVSLKNDVHKVRGKCFGRGTKVLMYDGSLKNIEHITLGDQVMGPDSSPRTVMSTHTGFDDMYMITPRNGNVQFINSTHDIYCHKVNNRRQNPIQRLITAPEFLKCSNNIQQQFRLEKTKVEFSYKNIPIDPYFIGLWLGDGSVGKTEICTIDIEIINYLKQLAVDLNCKYHQYPKKENPNVVQAYLHGGDKGIHKNKVKNILVDLGIFRNKFIPDSYLYNSRENRLRLLAGLIDTDGYLDRDNGKMEIIQKRKELAEQIVYLCRSLGFKCTIHKKFIKDYGDYWRVHILSNLEEIPTLLPRKQAIPFIKPFVKNPLYTTFKVEYAGVGQYFGFTVDKDNLFLLGDFTISHNSGKIIFYEEAGKFPGLKEAWNTARPSVEQGSSVHGIMIAFGTGGSHDADYEGLKDIFYEPDAYNCLPIENVWDDGASEPCGFFVPDYYNFGEEYMDQDGNSDVKGAVQYGLAERDKVIKNSSDRTNIDRYIAEHCFTPMEATLQISTNIFPKADLIKHLAFIRNNKSIQSFKQVGKLVTDEYGLLKWEQSERPKDLIKYRIDKDTDPTGEIVIWEHPVENPPFGLYIAGGDPYDFDQSGSGSLGSILIYKRFQKFESYYDILVAEYTGRPEKAEIFYENAKKLLQYYNAKLLSENQNPGIITYFRNNHVDYLLADQPDIIDKIIKNSSVNRAKGIHMTKEISMFAEGLIRDWLITERADGRLNLHTILSEPLIEELIAYNDKGNFDRVSALKVLMLYKEEIHNIKIDERKDMSKKMQLFSGGIFRDYEYDTYKQII